MKQKAQAPPSRGRKHLRGFRVGTKKAPIHPVKVYFDPDRKA